MKAWQITNEFGIQHLQQVDRPSPTLAAGQVRVRVRAVSLNYRDLLVINGQYQPKLPRPRVPGSDAAGEVVEVAPGVRSVRPGDRVMGTFFQDWSTGPISDAAVRSAFGGQDLDGVFAEEITLNELGVVPMPRGWTFEQAATLPCAAVTAWNALAEGHLTAGQTVLLQGTGGVSLFALQIAKFFRAHVLLISSSDDKLTRAIALGADDVLNYKTDPNWDKWARAKTAGRGVDHVVEVGGAGTLERSARAAKVGGSLALIGVLAGAGTMNPLTLLMRGQTLRGIFVGSRQMFTEMLNGFQANEIRPVLDDRLFSFDELPAALEYMQSGSHFGKIVVRV